MRNGPTDDGFDEHKEDTTAVKSRKWHEIDDAEIDGDESGDHQEGGKGENCVK